MGDLPTCDDDVSDKPIAQRARILQLTGRTIGGAAEHTLLLSRSLDETRFNVSVAFPPGGPLDSDFAAAKALRVFTGETPSDAEAAPAAKAHGAGLRPIAESVRLFDRTLKKNAFDIVHTHTSFAGAVGRLSTSLRSDAVQVHMLHAFMSHSHQSSLTRQFLSVVERRLGRLTEHFVVGSDAIGKIGVQRGLFDANHYSTIHCSIDITEQDRRRLSEHVALPADIPPGAFVLGFIGRLEEQKNVGDLLRVVAMVRRFTVRPVHLIIIGDGSERAELVTLASHLRISANVHWLGWRRNVPSYLTVVDALALTSRWESFGLVNLEAMAASKPCVAYAVEGICEVVESGETGILVEPGDVDAMARAVACLADDDALAERLGRGGRQRLERHFGHQAMVSAHERLYTRLMAERR